MIIVTKLVRLSDHQVMWSSRFIHGEETLLEVQSDKFKRENVFAFERTYENLAVRCRKEMLNNPKLQHLLLFEQ